MIYVASDYAGLSGGGVEFYFGYEETLDDEWCFTAKQQGEETLRLPQSKLGVKDRWNVTENLLAGIVEWLERTQPQGDR
jgi:hypothetical protein